MTIFRSYITRKRLAAYKEIERHPKRLLSLNDQQRFVMERRPSRSLASIGAELSLTAERIRQIEMAACRRLFGGSWPYA